MTKKIDMKNRVVDIYDCNTGECEDEIVSFLNRKMVVRLHSAYFSNQNYVFIHGTQSRGSGIVIKSYRKKQPGENISVSYQ